MTTLTKAKPFKGILQYKSTDTFTKENGYVYFIREFNASGETGNAEIYFGNRKYGEVNVSQLSEIESILDRIDELAQDIEGKQDIIEDIDNIREGATKGETAVQPGDISEFITIDDVAHVATTGSYNDLEDKPTIASAVTINGVNKTISNNKINIGTIPTAITINNTTKSGSTIALGTVVTGVTMNGSAKTVSNGNVDLGTIITEYQTLKTINEQTLIGSGNIIVGNIEAVTDEGLALDDVETNTYVKYVAQSLTDAQKIQVRENIGLSNTKSKITTSSKRSGTISLTANEIVHVASALTGSTTIQITHKAVNHDDEWGIKFFITSTTPPTISFTCSNSAYPISWLNDNMPIFENGYMYEMTFKQFNNKYLAVCGKFPI